ncbi:MAG: hypothetical protein WC867_07840 [Candidatus Pacearchaeota archaeon]|jgi:hypothetical protein
MTNEFEPYGYSLEYYFEDQGLIVRPRINFLDISSSYADRCINQDKIMPFMIRDIRKLNQIVYPYYSNDPDSFEDFLVKFDNKRNKKNLEPRIADIETSLHDPLFLLKVNSKGRSYYQLSEKLISRTDDLSDESKVLSIKIANDIYEGLLCNQYGEKGKSSPIFSI